MVGEEIGELAGEFLASSRDGSQLLLRWYAPPGHDPSAAGPAAVYLHGGGMITGTVALEDRTTSA